MANRSATNIPSGCNWNFNWARTPRTSFRPLMRPMNPIMKITLHSLTLAALTLAAATAHAKLAVIATTSDLGSLAKEIGGGQVDVTTLAKPTEDPHFVDAKPSFIVKLNHADAVVEGGGGGGGGGGAGAPARRRRRATKTTR